MATHKGIFKPTNPNKYKGDPTNIIYRSWYPVIKFEFNVTDFPTDADSNTMNEWIKRQWQRRAGIIK